MIPDQVLSTHVVPAAFRVPRNRIKEPLEAYELGGVALQDASQGLEVYNWRGRYIDGDIVLDVPGIVAPTAVLTIADVVEFCFTFDQNMQPAIAYMLEDDSAHFYWFDATVPGFVTLDLDEDTRTPRCSLDDKRDASGTLAGASDVILTYIRDDTLYFRAQRDRYETEYELELPSPYAELDLAQWELGQFGMNRKLRMQWQLVPVPLEEQ